MYLGIWILFGKLQLTITLAYVMFSAFLVSELQNSCINLTPILQNTLSQSA